MLPAPRNFQIDYQGRKYSGSYEIKGSDMWVSSAYGSKRQHISKSTDLDKVAKILLRQIVEERNESPPA